MRKYIINYQLSGGSFKFNDWFSTTNGKEVISYFFDRLLNPVNNSWAEDFGIPKNKLNKLNKNIIQKAIKKYLSNTKNIDIEELKNTGIWKSYTDSLPRDDILQIIVNELK